MPNAPPNTPSKAVTLDMVSNTTFFDIPVDLYPQILLSSSWQDGISLLQTFRWTIAKKQHASFTEQDLNELAKSFLLKHLISCNEANQKGNDKTLEAEYTNKLDEFCNKMPKSFLTLGVKTEQPFGGSYYELISWEQIK